MAGCQKCRKEWSSSGVYGGITTGETRPVRIAAGGIGADGPEDRGLSERCIIGFNAGPPFIPSLYNNNVQIFQSKDTVVLLTEMIHDARVVPLYESKEALKSLMMIFVSTLETHEVTDEDTLVVVTQNFNGLSASFGQSGTSYNKILTERFIVVGRTLWTMSLSWMTLPLIRISLWGSFQ